eukprot:1394785-Amorphochlora_amoeboformis.AAC.1
MDPSQRNLVNRLVLGGITALWLLFLDENKIGYSWTADVFRPAGETSHSSTPDFVFADNEIPADQVPTLLKFQSNPDLTWSFYLPIPILARMIAIRTRKPDFFCNFGYAGTRA